MDTNTGIRSQINLGFHCFYLEITWKIHGNSCHQRGGNSAPRQLLMNNYIVRSYRDVIVHPKDRCEQLEEQQEVAC